MNYGYLNYGYSTLTTEQAEEERKRLRAFTKELTSDPKKALAFLIEAGILDESGELAAKYRS